MPEKKFLIVDDEAVWRKVLIRLICPTGLAYVVVDNVEDAVAKLKEGGVTDLIVDGMENKWRTIVDAAGSARVTLVSDLDDGKSEAAKDLGIQFISKADLVVRRLDLVG